MRINLEGFVEEGSPTLLKLIEELDGFRAKKDDMRPTYMKLGKTEIDNLVSELPIKNLRECIFRNQVYLYGVQIDVFI